MSERSESRLPKAAPPEEHETALILDTIPELVFHLDAGHRIKWVNRAAAEHLGMSRAEAAGRPCREVLSHDQGICSTCPVDRVIREGVPAKTEIPTPDGRRWLVRGYPMPDEGQKVRSVVKVVEEITERRLLEENWRKYEFMANASGDFMTLIDRNYVYKAANHAYCRAVGKDRSEIVGRTVSDVWGQRDFSHPIKGYLDRCFAGETVQYEASFRFTGEEPQYFSVRYYPYVDAAGAVTSVVVVSHDITMRKRAEAALQESEERFRATFEQAAVGICLTSPDGRLIRMNDRYSEIMGYPPDELADMRFQDFTHPEDRSPDETQARRLLRGEIDTYTMEKRYLRKDGATVWGNLTVSLVREPDGSPKYFIAVVEDVTDRKRMAEEAKRQREQLFRADKMVSLGTLVSGVAHEINNPNTFISFNIPILRDYLDALLPIVDRHARDHPDFELFGMDYPAFRADLAKLLDNMEHGSDRIRSIVSGLRDFSQRRRGDPKGETADWVALRPILEDVITFCRGKITKMVETLETEIPGDLPLVWAEPQALEQILVNLLINAAHAQDKERSWIRLRVDPGGVDAGEVGIEVSDNGRGMDEETANKIFDPFFTTKPVGEGTGLGLYVCHNLIEGMDGWIEVESVPGEGSTFRVRLKRMPARI